MTQQLALIDAESDEALLLPPDAKRKRYTAGQVSKMEARLDCIVTMLAWGIPDDHIATAAHVNHRTLATIKGKLAEQIGKDAVTLANFAAGKAAKFLALADQKAESASAKDLAIMHGIARDTAINMRLTAGAGDMNEVTDIETENPALESARKFLAERNGKPAAVAREEAQEAKP